MKHPLIPSGKWLLPVLCLLTACNCSRPCCDHVVSETYVHPYGLEMSGNEWNRQGASGEVITIRKDGVTVKSTYRNGQLDGEVSYSHPHRETVARVEVYQNGVLTKASEYSTAAALRSESEFVSPQQRTERRYYNAGKLRSEETFANKLLQKGTYYSPTDGTVEAEVVDGQGKAIQRDAYGQLVTIDTIEEGAIAFETTYHPNGMPEAITPYAHGAIDGTRKTYLPGGEPSRIESWRNGKLEGTTEVYLDGEKVAEVPYRLGLRNGTERRLRNETEVVEEISWLNDQRTGPTTRYVDGQTLTEWYFMDARVSKSIYDARAAMLQP